MAGFIVVGSIVLAAVIFALIFRYYRTRALKKIQKDIKDLKLDDDDDD